ncbi:MAG: DUF4012 domain-containing protein [bacterium]
MGGIINQDQKLWDIKLDSHPTDNILIEDIQNNKNRKSEKYSIRFFKQFVNFSLLTFLIVSLVISTSALFLLKDKLVQTTYAGFTDSKDQILDLDKKFDINKVFNTLQEIEINLRKSEQTLTDFGQTGSYYIHFNTIGREISTVQRVSEIAKNIRQLSQNLKPFLDITDLSNLQLSSFREDIELSFELIDEINRDFENLKKSNYIDQSLFNAYQKDLDQLKKYLDRIKQTSGFLPEIMGLNGAKKYLILFQNPREARATGGFIGNYGVLSIENGELNPPDIKDIYYLNFLKKRVYKEELYSEDIYSRAKDFPESLVPPRTLIEEINWADWWNIKEGNWVADFPITAKKIEYSFNHIYHQGNVDGVIAIDPNSIVDILEIVGEIQIPSGEVLNAENFWDIIEYKVEIDNPFKRKEDLTVSPKQILFDFTDVLFEKLKNVNLQEYLEISRKIFTNLNSKNILLYFDNPRLQNLVEDLGFSGKLENYQQDYLYVNRSCRNAGKPSHRIKNNIIYSVIIGEDSSTNATLEINREHLGSLSTLDKYEKTFWQIMTPTDSRLLFSEINGKNNYSGIKVHNYLGTENFITYSTIQENEKQSMQLKYKLPFKIKSNIFGKGSYELLIQKQPGFNNDMYEVNIQFPLSWQVDLNSEYQVEDNIVTWKGKLKKDKKILINLRK